MTRGEPGPTAAAQVAAGAGQAETGGRADRPGQVDTGDPADVPGRADSPRLADTAGTAGTAETPEQRTARHFGIQALACEALGSTLYAGLLRQAAADLLAGGPTAGVLDGHLSDPGRSALSLRMLGGVHALVLTGRAPELARFYPSAGGTADPGEHAELAWPALRDVLAGQPGEVREWLGRPPQTNEVGRGAALAGALCHLVAEADLPVRLVEIGASAGLNLRADLFHITGNGVSYGPRTSPVQMPGAWLGPAPPVRPVTVISRTGGDLTPIDPVTEDGRLRLSAYVWADQVARFERLRGALDLAAQVPAQLRAEPASATIAGLELRPGTWTVLWHSIMRQYLESSEADAIAAGLPALGATATGSARFAHVSLELVKGSRDTPVELVTWPGGVRRVLGTAPPHGIPVTWA